MVGVVKDSALLTEEDCQVLNFVLSESGATRNKIEKQNLHDWSMSRIWYWAVLIGLVAVAVAVLAPVVWVRCASGDMCDGDSDNGKDNECLH